LAGEVNSSVPYELEGDLEALNLVDLESEGKFNKKIIEGDLNIIKP